MKKNHFLSLSLGLFMPFLLLGQLDVRIEYIKNYKQVAIDEMERAGIPASIKMAQALLESGAGTSTLAQQAKNHFGIKCGKEWSGQTMYRKDDDYNDKGKLIASCFRKYTSASASFRAHSQFLLDNRRYAFLFELDPTDYRGWAKGLKKAGYATSSTYANKLIQLIEAHELHLLDLGIYPDSNEPIASVERPVPTTVIKPHVTPKPTKPSVRRPASNSRLATISINDVKNVKARIGDTPEKIAAALHMNVKQLIRYNEFISQPNEQLNGGERVFLQPKRSSYRGKKKYHYVKANESMFDISQLYGIRLKSLYEKNRLDPGYEPAKGSKIKIRGGKVSASQKPSHSWKGNSKEIIVEDFEWEKELTGNQEEDGEVFLEPIETNYRQRENKPAVEEIKPEIVTEPVIVKEEPIKWEAPKKEEIIEYTAPKIEKPIPAPKVKPAPAKVSAPKTHFVEAGETLYRISKNYGLSVEELKAKNDLRSNTISIGQKLIVE